MVQQKVSIFWFRRDLRLEDNHGLYKALAGDYPVLPIFIFDTDIVDELEDNDPRITFIYDSLLAVHQALRAYSGGVYCLKGKPFEKWKVLLDKYDIQAVYANEDYEPYAIQRDTKIENLLAEKGIEFKLFKDQVIFAKGEVLKQDGKPYTVFTPYKNKWLETLKNQIIPNFSSAAQSNYVQFTQSFPDITELKFKRSLISVRKYKIDHLDNYALARNFPSLNQTSDLAPHLRFGTVSIRKIFKSTEANQVFSSELIWREFFMQILYHFPKVVTSNFKSQYDGVRWRNDAKEFDKWKNGETGYPMVDAGMRELNATGYMHNRVRMVVASFLCKHLLIDWKWGEAYFASKLLDYELSSNNGNWQWSAGTGCDAAPYFRVFNPAEQVKKFDPDLKYIKQWIPELNSFEYPQPMVDHKMARERAIATYKEGLQFSSLKPIAIE